MFCQICSKEFTPGKSENRQHNYRLFCSDDCRLIARRRIYNKSYNKKNNKKTDPVPVEEMSLFANPIKNQDKHRLKKKNIVSPDLSKMLYKYHDKAMKITWYFRTKKKMDHFSRRLKEHA